MITIVFFLAFQFQQRVETDTEDVLGEAAMENRRPPPPPQKGGRGEIAQQGR